MKKSDNYELIIHSLEIKIFLLELNENLHKSNIQSVKDIKI